MEGNYGTSVVGALDALADKLAGSDIDLAGKSVSEAIVAVSELVGAGGSGGSGGSGAGGSGWREIAVNPAGYVSDPRDAALLAAAQYAAADGSPLDGIRFDFANGGGSYLTARPVVSGMRGDVIKASAYEGDTSGASVAWVPNIADGIQAPVAQLRFGSLEMTSITGSMVSVGVLTRCETTRQVPLCSCVTYASEDELRAAVAATRLPEGCSFRACKGNYGQADWDDADCNVEVTAALEPCEVEVAGSTASGWSLADGLAVYPVEDSISTPGVSKWALAAASGSKTTSGSVLWAVLTPHAEGDE